MTDKKRQFTDRLDKIRYLVDLGAVLSQPNQRFLLAQIDTMQAELDYLRVEAPKFKEAACTLDAKLALAEEALDRACRCDKFHPDYALCGPCIALAALRKP